METAAKKALLPVAPASKPIPTPALLLAMLGISSKVSDLILSPHARNTPSHSDSR